jgi:hypothetical protein
MTPTRFTAAATFVALFCALPLPAWQASAPAPAPALSPEAQREFLLKARIVRTRNAGDGVTNSQRATLTDGTLTHDAHVQAVNVAKTVFEAGRHSETDFKDSYRFNIAAYRLSTLVGVRVPVAVERSVNGYRAAVSWWVDDVAMDEEGRNALETMGPYTVRATQQLAIMRVWDALIENRDRNLGNILWTKDFTMWLIDHTRAFRLSRGVDGVDRLQRCDRELLNRLRALTAAAVSMTVGNTLTRDEIAALMARRDAIVKHFDDRTSRLGEEAVLFTLEL